MKQYYVPNSISVFNHISAHRGAENNKASDHLPVYADFIFSQEGGSSNISVRIKSLLPNPKGIDAGNEKITLVNNSSNLINLSGWYLLDRSENKYELTGNIDINDSLTITLKDSEMPLNNNGDAIQLYNHHDNMIHQIIYAGYQVEEGKVIDF